MTDARLEQAIDICRAKPGNDWVDYSQSLANFEPDWKARQELACAADKEIYRRRTPCWIYFANLNDTLLKVGRSTKWESRLRDLTRQRGVEHKVIGVIRGDYREEAWVHRRFRKHRIKNLECGSREYYDLGPVRSKIDEVLRTGSIDCICYGGSHYDGP